MKKVITLLAIIFVSLFGLSSVINAQSIFKDLHPGAAHASPEQFINVNGTMYFTTNGLSTGAYWRGVWKSDGTVAGTVPVKDSIVSAATGALILRSNVNGVLFYTVNKSGPTAGDTTRLYKTDGSAPILVATLPHAYPPQNFTALGSKLLFSLNGSELWVSDGTTAGTIKISDPIKTVGESMVVYNGKVYFSGYITNGINELYSTDGTAAGTTLVKSGVTNPWAFSVYKNELYFASNGALWKTNGSDAGTVNIASTGFNVATIFKNELYYSLSGSLWKSDGTAGGTVLVKDSAGLISGATADFLFTKYLKPPTYNSYYCWKSDGSTLGTVRVSDSLGLHASFAVLNNKMYSGFTMVGAQVIKGFWETDGTEAGTKQFLPTSYAGQPFIFNNTVFFANGDAADGSELWSYNGGLTSIVGSVPASVRNIYPNPSSDGIFNVALNSGTDASLTVSSLLGETVHSVRVSGSNHILDLSHLSTGIYLLQIADGSQVRTQKIVIQK